ncbi:flagellar motor switch protein FliN [Parasphingorhabdus sp. JC815]|uniref:flagellar motor switch protein FliN n=1 Tax=Parasphingorhabdus sp. JC815 TaxID=3232140 RepID=UPI00345981E6
MSDTKPAQAAKATKNINKAKDSKASAQASQLPGQQPVKQSGNSESSHYRLLADIPVRLSVEVGSVSKRLADIMAFQEGEVVELDRQSDDLLDIKVNGTLVAKGEVVTIDGRFGVRIAELADQSAGFPAVERR